MQNKIAILECGEFLARTWPDFKIKYFEFDPSCCNCV